MSPNWKVLYWGKEYVSELENGEVGERTYREQGLHKFAHDATKEEANEEGEHQWAMTPEPYPSVFPLKNVGRHELE
jgi:hypothetical protein